MRFIIILLFLTGCGGATIVEEWPEGYPQEIREVEKKEYEVIAPEPVTSETFSIIEGREVTFVLEENHYLYLFDVTDGRARMRLDNLSFVLEENQTAIRSGIQLRIDEARENVIPLPRVSLVDVSLGGVRSSLPVGSTVQVGNHTVAITFVGLQDDIPHARIALGQESAILAEDEEHRFDELWVYVHGVYFNDATEYDLVDAVTVTVQEVSD